MIPVLPFQAIVEVVVSIAKKIPWKVWAFAGVIALCFVCYLHGKSVVQTEWDESVERGKVLLKDLTKNQGKITTKVETVYVDKVKVIHEKGKTIIKEVPVFVGKDECSLSGGFRLLHDAAASSTIPDPTKIPNAAPVSAQAVARTVTENYTTCHETAERLKSLQLWVTQQRFLTIGKDTDNGSSSGDIK